ncbi:MAG TPA: antitoxin [Thermoanaerobaculia bacterium]|nr:antitoxin [Thermoanaerobaculia bacterium]
MSAKWVLLESSIRDDLRSIERLYEDLGHPRLDGSETEEERIVVAYRLHNLYSAFENIFRNIAAAFENRLDERGGWHRELLRRMRLDLQPVRPALIDDETYEKLDEMLRFRHLFRAAYSVSFDPARLRLVLDKALDLRPLYPPQVERFLEFLHLLE